MNLNAERQISALFIREQVLQTVAIRNSFSENLNRIMNESNILASYSFPEFEDGQRSRSSMENLLEIELDSYRDCSAYSYFDFSGSKSVKAASADETGILALELVHQWEDRYKDEIQNYNESLFVPPIVINGSSVFLGLIFPVSSGEQREGMLTTIIDLKKPLDRYIKPIADEMSGIPIVINRSLTVLWDNESRINGRSFIELINVTYGVEQDEIRALIELNDSDSFRIHGDEQSFGESSINLSWSSFYIEDERIIIALLTDEIELMNILQDHDNERKIMFAGVVLFFLVASYGLFRIKFLIMKQELLKNNEKGLSLLVDDKTNKLQLLLNRYTALYESANDAITLMVDGVFVECNKKGLELFEAETLEQFAGKTLADFSPEFQDDGQRSDEKSLKLQNDCSEGVPQVFDWTHKTLMGHNFYAEVSIKTIDMDGTSITQAIVRDVSERIKSLKEKDVMMKEIHHRVKNNLQIINSLLSLQLENLSGKAYDVIVDTQRRVDVMAKMHELLYSQDDLGEISSEDYFREIISYFYIPQVFSSDFKIVYEFDDVMLEPETCMYTGLILSELVDNSIKHGSKTDKIDVKVIFKTGNEEAVLEVIDNGSGFVPENEHDYNGLGLKVIYALEAQLNGKMEWFSENGTRAVFKLKVGGD